MGFQELVQTFGWPIGSAIFAVICLYFDVIVSGKRYREVRRERDQLLRLALSSISSSEQSARMAKRVVDALVRQKDEADDGDGPTP